MEDWAEGARTSEYTLATEFELNAKPGKFVGLPATSATYEGKSVEITDRFGDLYLEEKQGRNEDTNVTDIDHSRRWIKKPKSADVATLLDRDDVKSTKVDIGSPLAVQTAAGARRYHDDKFLDGYYGNAWVGETGDVAVPFKLSNIIPAGGTSFSEDKILLLIEMMNEADIDIEEEMPIIFLDPKSETALKKIDHYINADFNERRPLVRGEIKDWHGCRFIKANLGSTRAYKQGSKLTQLGSNVVSLPCFVPSGLHRGVWTEFFGDIGPRRDKKLATQIYGEACSAVTRVYEEKCFQMLVDHS